MLPPHGPTMAQIFTADTPMHGALIHKIMVQKSLVAEQDMNVKYTSFQRVDPRKRGVLDHAARPHVVRRFFFGMTLG